MPVSSPSPCSAVASAFPFPPKLPPALWCPGVNRTSPLFNKLQAAFPLWERSGLMVKDYSGNGYTVDLTGTASSPTPVSWSKQWLTNFGPAPWFNAGGSPSSITLPNNFPNSTDFSISLWFWSYLTNENSGPLSTAFYTDGATGDTIAIFPSDPSYQNIYVSVDGNAASMCYWFEQQQWNHVVLSRCRNIVSVYVNSRPVGNLDIVTTTGSFTWEHPTMGAAWNGVADANWLYGAMSQFLLWNRPLQQGEVTELYLNPWGLFAPPILPQYSESLTGGGVVVGGTAAVTSSTTYTPIGGVLVGGTATPTGSQTWTPTGGLLAGGAATQTQDHVPAVSGGVLVGGAATVSLEVGVHGGVVMGGAATVQVAYAPSVSGGVIVGPPRFANGYRFRVAITVPSGKVASDQTNFVILINALLTASHVASSSDFRFETTGGTWLPHEVINYNASTGRLHAAVKSTLLTGSTNTIYLYYGGS